MAATRYVCSIKRHDPVSFMEIYGQGRIVNMANNLRGMNVTGLNALDLRTNRPDGTPWDFRIKAHRDLAEQLVRDSKPLWLIGCPPPMRCLGKPQPGPQLQKDGPRQGQPVHGRGQTALIVRMQALSHPTGIWSLLLA